MGVRIFSLLIIGLLTVPAYAKVSSEVKCSVLESSSQKRASDIVSDKTFVATSDKATLLGTFGTVKISIFLKDSGAAGPFDSLVIEALDGKKRFSSLAPYYGHAGYALLEITADSGRSYYVSCSHEEFKSN